MIVVGIDVGGVRRGFHAVALSGGTYFDCLASCNVAALATWCTHVGARAIGIDAPCCWSIDGRARAAELELAHDGISCFRTPTLMRARSHRTDYYGWMLNGARLYAAIRRRWRLFDGGRVKAPVCFETFPHAIACNLSGEIVPNAQKFRRRRELLVAAGIEIDRLTNVDLRDAALCALTAHRLMRVQRGCVKYGRARDGFIVVPLPRSRPSIGASVRNQPDLSEPHGPGVLP